MKTLLVIALLTPILSIDAPGQTKFDEAVRLYNEGRFAQSKSLFLEAAKENPQNAEVYYYLGSLVMGSDYDAAIDYLDKAISLNGAVAKYHFMLGDAYGVKAQRAGIFSKFGAASNCKEQWLIAVSLDPKYTDARMSLVEYYLQAPGIIGGSVEKAAAQSDTIKSYDTYSGYLAEARVHEYQKEKAQQEECYRKAISIDAKKPLAYRALWIFYIDENDRTKADDVFTKAVAAVDNKSDVYYQAGLYYTQKNDFTNARQMFDSALKRDPQNYPVYYQLGKVDLLSGTDLDKGVACFEKALNAHDVKNAPAPEYCYWRIGMIYEKLGKVDSARAAYRKSLELNPDLEESKKALEKLH
ncbi:MAG TPA: tetratricopeptide repeat protein [Candidatus Kryptonia bacterium]